jgi:hypothetical protein
VFGHPRDVSVQELSRYHNKKKKYKEPLEDKISTMLALYELHV